MRRFLKTALVSIALAAVAFAALAFWALQQSSVPMPTLSGALERGTLAVGGHTRSWLAYLPARLQSHPALVIVLHGSMGSAMQARAEYFGYDFDLLADRHGFLVVYPQGYQGYWNDDKVKGPYAAKREHVDDVAFLHDMVDRLVSERHVDRSRVYVTGVSNGGSMALRLALQTPEFARAYVVALASVPTAENMIITPRGQPVSIAFMNGTADPINPWQGGDVVLWPVLGNRGPVLPVQASVDTFRALAGLDGKPEVTQYPDRAPGDASTVARSLWSAPGKRTVALYTISGGGHSVPHPAKQGMRLLGNSNRDIHAADAIWTFFESAPQ